MFESLSEKISAALKNLKGQSKLTDDNIKTTLREVRVALLEADVALPVITQFIDEIKEKALGQSVMSALNPGQAVIKIVNDSLVHIMGDANVPLNLAATPPVVVSLVGLQGTGKTTSAAKLALHLKSELQKKVLLVSADIYRPAAMTQLQTLASQIDVPYFEPASNSTPQQIAEQCLHHAKTQFIDVIIFDTAGRLHIDDVMMNELIALNTILQPTETLLVVDSMVGQDAAQTAKVFHDRIPITGIILTKTDGDSRGGAALSVRQITGQPIKFIGNSEKIDGLQPFHPERMASRILGMGDVLSFIEEAEKKIDKKETEKLAKKLKKGKSFTLEDFKKQLMEMEKLGGMTSLMSQLPGIPNIPQAAKDKIGDGMTKKTVAIINSMTLKERYYPELVEKTGSRKKRIAAGSGTTIQEVNKLLKQFTQMQKMMKKFAKPGAMQQMMRGMGGMNFLPFRSK